MIKEHEKLNRQINKWINCKHFTWYRKWIVSFSWYKEKNNKGSDNTKQAEKDYFHCGSKKKKAIKST